MGERCIDYGSAYVYVPQKAKKAVTDSLDSINEFKYTIAIPVLHCIPSLRNLFQEKNIVV